MQEKWRGVNYNKGFKNVKELFYGPTFGFVPNAFIIDGFSIRSVFPPSNKTCIASDGLERVSTR